MDLDCWKPKYSRKDQDFDTCEIENLEAKNVYCIVNCDD